MALRGVWQLQKLVVNYCDWGGSSRGIRAFMESHLPALKEKNPQLEVVTQLVRGQHPNLKGIYKNHNERVVCVRNLPPEDIMLQASRLRCSLGRKVVKLRTRHVTKRPSVQGTWTTELKISEWQISYLRPSSSLNISAQKIVLQEGSASLHVMNRFFKPLVVKC